jgi:hypothetical protein
MRAATKGCALKTSDCLTKKLQCWKVECNSELLLSAWASSLCTRRVLPFMLMCDNFVTRVNAFSTRSEIVQDSVISDPELSTPCMINARFSRSRVARTVPSKNRRHTLKGWEGQLQWKRSNQSSLQLSVANACCQPDVLR